MTTALNARSNLKTQLISGALVAFGVAYACSQDSDSDSARFDPGRQKTLEASADCALSMSERFADQIGDLVEAVEAWEESPEDNDLRETAGEVWKESNLLWQEAEVTQFGPAGKSTAVDKGGTVGGQDLRDLIYSWTLVNSCRVDQGLVNESFEDLESEAVNLRGLDALEYLLFYDDAESTCPSTTDIIGDGTWDDVEDLSARRAEYALAAAEDVQESALALVDAWSPDGEDFSASLKGAGESGPYPSQQAALDEVVEGLIYVDSTVKDLKLGIPVGIHADCPDETCPEDFEHQWAGVSKSSISANVDGFERLYSGCGSDAFGFDDLLIEKDGQAIAEQIEDALAGIREALDAIEEEDLRDALEDDPQSLEELHAAIKALTDILKNEFIDTLDANLRTVGGDND